ncbi:LysR family transcriptional regulator [Enterovirga rhinocerotis]|uniref:LysR family transcriptional regulator n=1 Tax=Enterovirga rhinocerotis TaxID=1339210 RepID=A0A4R7BJX6_9HYPH|nr:LysR family transcriptional regulator [Enterovirga rhinocerotis]TDR84505.1 LysR family transcriptional regulator [Enterovirga rhinocerotis]
MDQRKLRYFVAVAEELHVGRAARRLNMAQPPLTRLIQQLEADMGSALFVRTRKGVQLTNAGSVLLDEARNLLLLASRAKERTRMAGLGRSGRLDIGVFGSNMLVVPDLLLHFTRSYPDVDLAFHAMNKQEQLQALYDRRTTIGFNFLGLKLAGISNEKVRSEPLVVAMPATDPLADRPSVRLAEVAERPFVVPASGPRPNLLDFVFALCLEAGFRPRISQEVADSVTAVALVAAGFGVSLVPQATWALQLANVVFKPLDHDRPASVDLHCIYRTDDTSLVLKAFLETIEATRQD